MERNENYKYEKTSWENVKELQRRWRKEWEEIESERRNRKKEKKENKIGRVDTATRNTLPAEIPFPCDSLPENRDCPHSINLGTLR